MRKMRQSFRHSNKSYFQCIRLAMISKQKITQNLGGLVLADSFHLSNTEKSPENQTRTVPLQYGHHAERSYLLLVLYSHAGVCIYF